VLGIQNNGNLVPVMGLDNKIAPGLAMVMIRMGLSEKCRVSQFIAKDDSPDGRRVIPPCPAAETSTPAPWGLAAGGEPVSHALDLDGVIHNRRPRGGLQVPARTRAGVMSPRKNPKNINIQ
jgi:hypothetical protein